MMAVVFYQTKYFITRKGIIYFNFLENSLEERKFGRKETAV